jgi:hypothetical protein
MKSHGRSFRSGLKYRRIRNVVVVDALVLGVGLFALGRAL